MAVTLSRAATLTVEGRTDAGDLADVYCAAARHRIADAWRQAMDNDEPDYGQVARRWLQSDQTTTEGNDDDHS
jgi:hypothetical protein